MCDYQHDEACKIGAEGLHSLWKTMQMNSEHKVILLTRKRTLMPIYLGTYIMREIKRNGMYHYSVVTYPEVEHETVMSTTIPKNEPEPGYHHDCTQTKFD
jgi:hypothetical protein